MYILKVQLYFPLTFGVCLGGTSIKTKVCVCVRMCVHVCLCMRVRVMTASVLASATCPVGLGWRAPACLKSPCPAAAGHGFPVTAGRGEKGSDLARPPCLTAEPRLSSARARGDWVCPAGLLLVGRGQSIISFIYRDIDKIIQRKTPSLILCSLQFHDTAFCP